MFYERLQLLAKKNKKSLNQIEKELELPKNTLYNYKKNSPTTDRLNALAKYFNVSTDYLLGREENKPEETLDEVMNAYGFSDTLKQSIKSTENYSGKPLTEENYKAMADLVNTYLQSIKAENHNK
jgi:transcriptional regulator with XRE-family HTH domain